MKCAFGIASGLVLLSIHVYAQNILPDKILKSEEYVQSGEFFYREQDASGEEMSENYEDLCGDLLEIYAQKPNGLEFVCCEKIEESQTIVRATYRVSGKQSKDIEDFLVNNYDMGRLKWACCAWDTGGKYGSFEHHKLTAIDPDLSVIIYMYASGEVANKNKPTKVKLETKREKIDYFTVVVELAIV